MTLELTPEQERQIEAEARRRDEEDSLLPAGLLPPANGTGADLVAYWEREGLIGTPPDIEDSLGHARAIRRKVERRTRI